MNKSISDQTLALAGMFQCASLVSQLARSGDADIGPLETVLRSLYVSDPQSTVEVYGSVDNLTPGLELIPHQLGEVSGERNVELTRYVIAMLYLERKLSRRKDLMNTISEGLEAATKQVELFGLTHANVMARLADIYMNTVSTLSPRIMVSGEHGHLQNPYIAERVRAVLLAGIRSAVLWRQVGGSRWRLLLSRRRYVEQARQLLRSH